MSRDGSKHKSHSKHSNLVDKNLEELKGKYKSIGSGKGYCGFKKGQVPNPKGRPKGLKDKRHLCLAVIETKQQELVDKAVTMALNGDAYILKFLLNHILPAKPKDNRITLDDFNGTISEQGDKIIQGIATGEITPIEGLTIMSSLTANSNIKQAEETEKRLKAIEDLLTQHNKVIRTIDGEFSVEVIRDIEDKAQKMKETKNNE